MYMYVYIYMYISVYIYIYIYISQIFRKVLLFRAWFARTFDLSFIGFLPAIVACMSLALAARDAENRLEAGPCRCFFFLGGGWWVFGGFLWVLVALVVAGVLGGVWGGFGRLWGVLWGGCGILFFLPLGLAGWVVEGSVSRVGRSPGGCFLAFAAFCVLL